MFEDVVAGIRDRDAGRDAVALARELVVPRGKLTLVHVDVVSAKPAPDSASARDALRRREAHAEFADDAVEGLHAYLGSVDLLVIGAHDYTPVDHLLERSTSQRLADDASTPLLVLATADPAPVHASQ